jgi:hypothetical protein|tara:strand:+ start:352 stop:618 length:267 start_codon:yes stop_codon:yes gene_type:complete
MKLKDILKIQSIIENRATPYDILEEEYTYYSKSKDEHINLLDLHLIHFIRIFLKQVEENNNGTKKERIEEIQYSLNQILEDVRELKDD